MAKVTLKIQNGADDGYINTGSSSNFGDSVVKTAGAEGSDGHYSVFRFTGNHGIPKYADINSANLVLTSDDGQASIISMTIEAIDEDNPTQLTGVADYDSRIKTVSKVNWVLGITVQDGYYQTPDIKDILTELVNRPNWTDSSSILFVVRRTSPTSGIRNWKSYETSTSECATLVVDFDDPGGTKESILHAKARIMPSASDQASVNAVIRDVEPKLLIQWDGMIWEDESDRVISAQGDQDMQGELGEGLASQADFELDNTDGRFTPENTDSPIYAYLNPRVNLKFYTVIGGKEYLQFTGYIKAIEPDRSDGIVNIHCFDNAELVLNKTAPRDSFVDMPAHKLIEALAVHAGLDPDTDMDLEESSHIVRAAYFGDRNIWPIMGEIAVAERGRVFYDVDGRLKFWSREHMQRQERVMSLTRLDHFKKLEYTVEEQHIKNIATVTARPRAAAPTQPVWTNGGSISKNPYTDILVFVPANDTQYAFLEITDAYGPLPVTDWIQPVPYIDFIANDKDDNSGTDYTNSIKINQFITYADAVFIEVQNLSPVDVYLFKFQVRAKPLKIFGWIKVRHDDPHSVALFGEQRISIENDFIDDEQMANDIAETEVSRRKNAKNLFKGEIIGVPYLSVGDVVGIEIRDGNIEDYMISSIKWKMTDKGYTQNLQFVEKVVFPSRQKVEARANIFGSVKQSVEARARIATVSQTIEAKGMVTDMTEMEQTVTAKGRLRGFKQISAKGKLRATVTKTFETKANITT